MNQDELENIAEENKEKVITSTLDTNRIMGLAAIFISLLSMAAVIYQSYLAREDNELTRIQQSAAVLPYLDFWYSNVGEEYKFVLENKGVGPAFIKEVKFIGVDSENKDSLFFKSSHQAYDFVVQQSSFIDSISVTRSSLYANMLLSPGEKKNFYVLSFENDYQENRFEDEFYKHYAGFEIVYEDVYGAAWVLDTEKGHPVKLDKN